LNEAIVTALPAPKSGNKITFYPEAVIQGAKAPRGFGVRVTAAGTKAFVMVYRIKGRQHVYAIGRFGDWSVLKAVQHAKTLRQRIDRGDNPLNDKIKPTKTQTVADVIDDFVEQYVRDKERPLRTADAYESTFERLVKPAIGKIGIYDLRRSHVAKMQDKIVKERGPVMADRTRQNLRKALTWYAERDDTFNLNAAIVRVAPRANAKDRARTRVLSEDEIRIIWPVLGETGTFGALIKALLLTAQRRDEVASMSLKEIDNDGIWTIPADRYKTKRPNFVPLSKAALAVIEEQKDKIDKAAQKDKTAKCDYVFASSAKTPFSAFGKSKAALDKAILSAMQKQAKKGVKVESLPNWTLHDLRRTAKTIMSSAGVRPDISERVLGHVITGVEGTYDRHSYADEKRDALENLAARIDRILKPPPSNVAILNKKRVRT
jgi:integrase